MKDDNDSIVMRSCPSCMREVPQFWEVCQFCGNVFKKSEPSPDETTMFCWAKKD